MYNANMEVKTLNEILLVLESELPNLRNQHHVKSLGLFGSYVKDLQDHESDLDILVTFNKVPGLFGFIGLENQLSQLLGIKVDLVMEDALKPTIAERIRDEVIRI